MSVMSTVCILQILFHCPVCLESRPSNRHHSFEAFNEGVRLQECIEYQQELTGVKVTRVGADTIYANNDNRRYCTENGMTTCFVRFRNFTP